MRHKTSQIIFQLIFVVVKSLTPCSPVWFLVAKSMFVFVTDGDILIHCGDFSTKLHQRDFEATVEDFDRFLGSLGHRHKVTIRRRSLRRLCTCDGARGNGFFASIPVRSVRGAVHLRPFCLSWRPCHLLPSSLPCTQLEHAEPSSTRGLALRPTCLCCMPSFPRLCSHHALLTTRGASARHRRQPRDRV